MKWKEIYVRWIGIPILAIIAAVNDKEGHMDSEPFWYIYLVSLCFTTVYWNGACIVIFYFRRKFPEISKTGRRLFFTGLGIILWMWIGGIPLKILFEICEPADVLTFSTHADWMPFNLVAATVISLGYEAFYFFDKWKEQFRVNEQLKNQQIKTQYEVLQNQMSPHFLFNSLNTLASIIPDDPDAAVNFTEKLSEVYRYILTNKDKELVELKDELDFVKSFIFLLSIRYPNNLKVEFAIEEKYSKLTIPPMTLQMLVENAIKHNVVSKSRPLHISIYIENGKSLVVKNNLQLKDSAEKSTKTGLENIKKRYLLLGGKQVDIITSAANFMVAVPLIDLLEEKDITLA